MSAYILSEKESCLCLCVTGRERGWKRVEEGGRGWKTFTPETLVTIPAGASRTSRNESLIASTFFKCTFIATFFIRLSASSGHQTESSHATPSSPETVPLTTSCDDQTEEEEQEEKEEETTKTGAEAEEQSE